MTQPQTRFFLLCTFFQQRTHLDEKGKVFHITLEEHVYNTTELLKNQYLQKTEQNNSHGEEKILSSCNAVACTGRTQLTLQDP